jgi:hypothetical protein
MPMSALSKYRHAAAIAAVGVKYSTFTPGWNFSKASFQ